MSKMLGAFKQNWATLTALLLTFVLLIPVFMCCFYVVPTADDLHRSGEMKALLANNASVIDYFADVFALAANLYATIQGSFTVDVLIYLNPAAFSYNLAPVPAITSLVLFLVATWLLASSISKYILKSDWRASIWIWAFFTFLTIQFVSPSENFFWYAGIVAYTIPFTMCYFSAAILVRLYFNESKKVLLIAVASVLCFLIGGSHYPVALFASCSMAALLVWCFVKRKKFSLLILAPVITGIIALLLNITAPGNSNRLIYYTQMQPVKAIYKSFEYALFELADCISTTPLLFLFVLAVPFLISVIPKLPFKFKYPGIMTVFSVCLYATAFTPGFYATGGYGVVRYFTLISWMAVWFISIMLFYWLGWAVKKYDLEVSGVKKARLALILSACLAFVVPFNAQPAGQHPILNMTSILAADDLVYGEVREYNIGVKEMFEKIESSDSNTVTVSPALSDTRTMLEILLENDTWQIEALSYYFGKTVVVDEKA